MSLSAESSSLLIIHFDTPQEQHQAMTQGVSLAALCSEPNCLQIANRYKPDEKQLSVELEEMQGEVLSKAAWKTPEFSLL